MPAGPLAAREDAPDEKGCGLTTSLDQWATDPPKPTPDVLRGLYETMVRIRTIEEAIVARYPEQEMRCPTHLSIGQEAVAAGICAHLRPVDYVLSGHRCHAHYIAKGGDVKGLIAELYGKSTGCARGWGGSMHLMQPDVGMMGAVPIMGAIIPIAVGTAFAAKMRGDDRVAVAFFGDGAAEEGVFHESLNFAALYRLPVIFACENNLYATHSPQQRRQPADNLYEWANSYQVPGERVDGNDVLAVYAATGRALERCRRQEGPSLIEFRTYRWMEHVGPYYDYDLGYRSKAELDAWMERCPIKRLEAQLLTERVMSRSNMEQIGRAAALEAEEAFRFALDSPFPDPAELQLLADW